MAKKPKSSPTRSGPLSGFAAGVALGGLLAAVLCRALFVPRAAWTPRLPSRRALEGPMGSSACRRAEAFLATAGRLQGVRGHLGWLFLLGAVDLCPEDSFLLEQLVGNYRAAGYADLARDELRTLERTLAGTPAALPELRRLLREVEAEVGPMRLGENLAAAISPPTLSLPFSTAVAQWDLSSDLADPSTQRRLVEEFGEAKSLEALHEDFNRACVELYEDMKAKAPPGLSDTELNHRFFQYQMGYLRRDGKYHPRFESDRLFALLKQVMKASAAQLLQVYGFSQDDAWTKANHRAILWASVHTSKSVHEPHMTEDSLIGGVYYSRVPSGSGHLALYDPRGMSPILRRNFSEEIVEGIPLNQRAPHPPFHRIVDVEPKEGKLVLFPGWLIHQVLPSPDLDTDGSGYRVSVSVNLKGEWQDTAALMLDELEYPVKQSMVHS